MTRVLIMAGGTGGHVFPALSVAEELVARGIHVAWIGTAAGIEAKLVPAAGYPLFEINVKGLRGNGALGWLLAPYRVMKAVWESRLIIKQVKPDVVIGMGGFASGPGGFAAKMMSKSLLIHEQNSIPGLTNRLLAKIADTVLTGFPNSFPADTKAQWVGNPVRKAIEDLPMPHLRQSDPNRRLQVLVLGGSLGAASLNQTMPAAVALLDPAKRPLIRHQCGSKHLHACEQHYRDAGIAAEITDFIADMAKAYAWADLVICRAGALTVAELASAGVASILVPYPYAVDDHQTHNAQLLINAGAAELLADKNLSAMRLANKLDHYHENREELLAMANAAKQVAKVGTATRIADICEELAHG